MSVAKLFLERAQSLGLLDEKVLDQLRKQVADAKGPVSAESLAKVLVQNGHLTIFQAKKLVGDVTAAAEQLKAKKGATARPPSSATSAAPKTSPAPAKRDDELSLASDDAGLELLDDPKSAGTKNSPALGADELEVLDEEDGLELLGDDDGLEPLGDDDGLELLADEPPAKPAKSPSKPQQTSSPASKAPVQKTPAKPTAPAPTPKSSAAKATPAAQPAAKKPASSKATKPAPATDDELEPIGSDELAELEDGLSPLDEALGADPLLASAAAPSPLAAPKKSAGVFGGGGGKNKNQWDSALVYVGIGALLLLGFAFVVLYLSLSRGSANEDFQLAEDDFSKQAFEQAIGKYESYLSRYGDEDSNASLARVRIGVAQIRIASAAGKDASEALAVTRETVERIVVEERFDEARGELADILTGLADRLAQQARRAVGEPATAATLVAEADAAMEMINNSAYIPPNLRQPIDNKVSAIGEEIAFVKRELNQDQELKSAVAAMQEATAAGKTAAATELRRAFLKKYPGLDANTLIQEATLAIAKKEQELVVVSEDQLAPMAAQDPQLLELVFAAQAGNPAPGPSTTVAMTLRGSVYGIDSASGKLLWRRFIGFESLMQPVPVSGTAGADVLVVDARSHDLLRLKLSDGSVAWRLPIGEPAYAPTVVGDVALVSVSSGMILEVDLQSGESKRRAKLPQGAIQNAGYDPRRPHIYQLGEQSTLFVLSTETLQCREALFLGHLPGGIAVPPVTVGGQIFVAHNAGADYSFIHILAADAEGLNLQKKRDPVRMKGRVVKPPIVDGRRVYVFTDLGAAHVFDVDPANVSEPVVDLTRLIATRKEPLVGYAAISEGRVWLCDERMTQYELQPARKELTRKWSRFEGEAFLAPPLHVGESLITARARNAVGDVVIAAVNASDGSTLWTTSVSIPVRTLVPRDDGALAIDANASVFSLAAATSGVVSPLAVLSTNAEPPLLRSAWLQDDKAILVPHSGEVRWAAVATGLQPPKVALIKPAPMTAQISAAPISFEGGVLLPLDNGQVMLVNSLTGKPILLPFQPPLEPGNPPAWKKPLALDGANAMFAIANERGRIYLGQRKEQPQPHLAVVKMIEAGAIVSDLVQLEDNVAAVIEKDGQYVLQRFALPDLAATEPTVISSPVVYGPRKIGEGLLVATVADGLMMLDSSGKTQWKLPLENAAVVGIGNVRDEIVAVTSRGELWRVNGQGMRVGNFATQRPLSGDPVLVGQTLWCPGVDGAVYGLAVSALGE